MTSSPVPEVDLSVMTSEDREVVESLRGPETEALRIGSLCSGYGGLDLGLMSVVGGAVMWHVENDKHPSAVLDARWPGVPNYGDLTAVDWSQVEPVDWLTAGYPCQPFSHAGKRKGASDERHLWPAVARAVGVLRPRRVLLENVRGHVSLGLNAVLGDLAELGYDAIWGVVRASDAGACHGRARLFILASDAGGERHGSREDGRSLGRVDREDAGEARQRERTRAIVGDRSPATPADSAREGCERPEGGGGQGGWAEPTRCIGLAPDTDRRRRSLGKEQHRDEAQAPTDRSPRGKHTDGPTGAVAWGDYEPAIRRWERITGRQAPRPTAPGRTGERLSPLFVEWLMGLRAGWVTDILSRNPALKALGNGVVPQQAALAVSTLLQLEQVAA